MKFHLLKNYLTQDELIYLSFLTLSSNFSIIFNEVSTPISEDIKTSSMSSKTSSSITFSRNLPSKFTEKTIFCFFNSRI